MMIPQVTDIFFSGLNQQPDGFHAYFIYIHFLVDHMVSIDISVLPCLLSCCGSGSSSEEGLEGFGPAPEIIFSNVNQALYFGGFDVLFH